MLIGDGMRLGWSSAREPTFTVDPLRVHTVSHLLVQLGPGKGSGLSESQGSGPGQTGELEIKKGLREHRSFQTGSLGMDR